MYITVNTWYNEIPVHTSGRIITRLSSFMELSNMEERCPKTMHHTVWYSPRKYLADDRQLDEWFDWYIRLFLKSYITETFPSTIPPSNSSSRANSSEDLDIPEEKRVYAKNESRKEMVIIVVLLGRSNSSFYKQF